MKNKFWLMVLVISSLLAIASACKPAPQTEPVQVTASPSPTNPPIQTPSGTPTLMPTPAYTPLPKSEGPTLLLQTDFHTYQIIDFGLGIIYDFHPPVDGQDYALGTGISPNQKQMIFITDAKEIQIVDLETGNIRAAFTLNADALQPEDAVNVIHEALPDLAYSEEMLINAIENAYLESIQNVNWFQDEDHLLSVLPVSGISACLTLIDLQSGQANPLENEPGFVQFADASPDGDFILLKKSLIFDANVWEDDRYYLVDLENNAVNPISLPDDVDNPYLSWMDQDNIRVMHKNQVSGSEGFSIIDSRTLESTLLIEGPYNIVWKYGENLAVFTREIQEDQSLIQIMNLEGEILNAQTLPGSCFRTNVVGGNILVNCDAESLILDQDLTVLPFGNPYGPFRSSQTGIVIVDRNHAAFLYDQSLQNRQPLTLAGDPLEFLWLPDGSGFLYRTLGMLYQYDLITNSSHLLLESELFKDYTNLNAAWINLH